MSLILPFIFHSTALAAGWVNAGPLHDGCAVYANFDVSKATFLWDGGCVNGKASGEGLLILAYDLTGKPRTYSFNGSMVDGLPVGGDGWVKPDYLHAECAIWHEWSPSGDGLFEFSWDGGCTDGKASGKGTLLFETPGQWYRYSGTMVAGKFHAGTWYADADGDGYTDPGNAIVACQPPEGYAAATQDDCDDADATSHPAGDDIPDDGIDQDCDGTDAAGDTGDTSDSGDPADNGDGKDPTACGCTSTSGGAPWSLALGVLALTRRRRAAQRGSVPPPLPLLRARGGRRGAR